MRREFGGVLYVWRAVRARAGEGRAPGARARGEGERAVTSLRPQVLHHFFFERWEHPSAWFEHRLAYSRSLGSSTIVGFLLGLGDRHCSNILLDQRLLSWSTSTWGSRSIRDSCSRHRNVSPSASRATWSTDSASRASKVRARQRTSCPGLLCAGCPHETQRLCTRRRRRSARRC